MSEPRYLIREAAEVPAGDGWLSVPERRVLAGLVRPARRRDWLLGRFTAKGAVANRIGLIEPSATRAAWPLGGAPPALARIEIRAAGDGAPEAFLDGDRLPVGISLSHRDGRAVCATAPLGAAIGCDLERVEARDPAWLEDFFTDDERAGVLAGPDAGRDRHATLLWSAKESVLKSLREGLRLDTRSVEIDLPAASGAGACPSDAARDAGEARDGTAWDASAWCGSEWCGSELGGRARDGRASDRSASDGGPASWRPFAARCTERGLEFHGWWRCLGPCILTIAAGQATASPAEIR